MPRAALYKGQQGCLALGYLSEHFRIAFQVAVAIGLGMLFIVINKTYDFLGDASVWIVVSVVVAFSNNLGATFQRALLAIAGSVVGAALGILIIALLSGLATGFSFDNHPKTMSAWACILMALVGFMLALNKERFPKMGLAFSFALLTYPIVAIPGFREADENYMERLKLSLCTLIGVLLTVLVAVVLFPIRARTKLRQRTAEVLERMGNLAFYLMGEFCEDPDDEMRLKGSSGTDEHQHYVDDGLQQKYEGLHQMRLALNRDLIDMSALIGPASAELSYLKLFRRKTSHYSMDIYRDVNRQLFTIPVTSVSAISRTPSCRLWSRLCGRCLTTLGSLHMYMEGGHMRMGLCMIHKKLIQELRQDIAAAFTCLSGLIINKESDEDARETMENLCSAALEFQATMYSLPIRAEYNVHVETLALFSKISTSVARQAASMYMELRPEGGARIHKVLCTHMDRTSSKPLSVEDHSPAPSRANSAEPNGSPYGRPSKENAQALSRIMGDSAPASPQEWDIEKGSPGLLTLSPDPLLRLGRLPSISESGSRRKLPLNMPSGPIPSYVRAMSFPGHLLMPESVFGIDSPLPPAPRPAPKGSPVEQPVEFPPVSSSESCSDQSSGLSPRASFPQRPSSKQFRDMLREHLKAQRTDSEHSEGTQPIERQSLDSATSAEEPDSAASAPGPGTAGQDGPSQNTGSRPKRHVSFGRPPVHCLSGSLPASHSGSIHMQGNMQCGSLSDDDEDDDNKNDDRHKADDHKIEHKDKIDDHRSASRAGSLNTYESCELCHVSSGIKDGKPSPWMWSRSTSFQSPDNPF